LGLRRVRGLFQGNVAEEGVNRRQPSVSAARPVAPFLLQVIEEGDQEWGIDLGEPELRGFRLQPPLGELQEQAERVAVAGDGVRADAPLADQPTREKLLEQPGKRGLTLHCRSPTRSRRSVARRSNSGTAVR